MKSRYFSLLFAFLFINSSSFCEELQETYTLIHDLPFDNHGWFFNGDYLETLITSRNAKTVIEVGSWLGLSTRFIATKVPDEGKVYAVDTWLGSPTETVHMEDPRLPYLYQLFLSNVKHARLTHKIIPIRMKSLEAASALNINADLIYIDASHETNEVFQDILAWNKHLNTNGVICGDDWLWESVRNGVVQAASILNKKVNYINNFWWYE